MMLPGLLRLAWCLSLLSSDLTDPNVIGHTELACLSARTRADFGHSSRHSVNRFEQILVHKQTPAFVRGTKQ